MNFITRLVTTAFIVPLSFGGVAPAAEARHTDDIPSWEQVHEYCERTANAKDYLGCQEGVLGGTLLVRTLNAADVTMGFDNCDGTTLGQYRYSKGAYTPGHIVLCSNNLSDFREMWTTLRHEAVHAAQHCRGWDTVMEDTWLRQNARESDAQFIVSAYDQEDHLVELEAFTLERQGNDLVQQLVNDNCEAGMEY